MWFTLPLDVIWKHHMGERHWTFGRLIIHTIVLNHAMFFLMLLASPDLLVPPSGQTNYRQVITIYGFIAVMWIFGLANLWEIRQRKKAGIEYYTHYWGRPRLLPNKPIVHCVIIPVGSAFIAYCFYRLLPPLGIYLYLMAGCQFLDATGAYRTERVEKLNRRDREMQMELKTAELEDIHRGPLDIVRLAPPSKRERPVQEHANFEKHWQRVLTSHPS